MTKIEKQFVGNKAEGQISKRVIQENKARHIFRKNNIFQPLIRTVKNVRFSENLTCFIFLKFPFWDPPFCLITDELASISNMSVVIDTNFWDETRFSFVLMSLFDR